VVRALYKKHWRILRYIPKSQRLWRVIPPEQIDEDGTLKSGFFRSNGLSSDIAILTSKRRCRMGHSDPRTWPATHGLAQITVGMVKEVSHSTVGVSHDPLTTPKDKVINYSHAIFDGRLTAGQAKQLRNNAKTLILPKAK